MNLKTISAIPLIVLFFIDIAKSTDQTDCVGDGPPSPGHGHDSSSSPGSHPGHEQGPSGPPGSHPGHEHGGGSSPGHEHGGGHGGGLTVTVAYEALTPQCKPFFQKLDAKTVEELSKCGIKFKFLPCSTSSVVNGHLTCWQGQSECEADKVYACATKLNENKGDCLGKFVICMMNAGSKPCSGSNCAKQSGLDNWQAIETCSKSTEADQNCHKYWSQINNDMKITTVPGVMFNQKFDESTSDATLTNFKDTVCKQASTAGINCSACGGSGGTGGNGHNNPSGTPPGHGHGGGGHGHDDDNQHDGTHGTPQSSGGNPGSPGSPH